MDIVETSAWPFEARASVDGWMIASSFGARRFDADDAAPVLLFPSADVLIDGTPLPDGAVLAGTPEGWVAFDPDAVLIELVDAPPDADPRDVTVKRFPTWGDAADLVRIMDVRPIADNGSACYGGVVRGGQGRSIVEGSQLLGQSIIAACREIPGRRVVSASMVFMRVVDDRVAYVFEVERLSAGRTFSTLAVHVVQHDRRAASALVLLGVPAPDVIRHDPGRPDVPGPDASEPYDMSVTGRDLRVVGGTYSDLGPGPLGPPSIDAWVRFRELPDDPALHVGLATQFTGHMSIAAALRPHGIGQEQAHRTLTTGPLAINVSFHADVRADRWLLYRHLATVAGEGMTHAECRIHDEAGALVASFTVDAMVKGFESTPMDARRAL